MRFAIVETAWGAFGYVERAGKLVATQLSGAPAQIRRTFKKMFPEAQEGKHLLPGFERDVRAYFAGEAVTFDVPLDLTGVTSFRRRVLKACASIPYGETVSYADLARRVSAPGAARAVGGAMAANPLPLVIPCHRVLRSDGALGGFSAPQGVSLKKRMLNMEAEAALVGA